MRRNLNKKAMSTFEVISYAILTLVVIIVCIFIFQKLTKAPSSSIGSISDNTAQNAKDCQTNPAQCDPFAKAKTSAPPYTAPIVPTDYNYA